MLTNNITLHHFAFPHQVIVSGKAKATTWRKEDKSFDNKRGYVKQISVRSTRTRSGIAQNYSFDDCARDIKTQSYTPVWQNKRQLK